MYVCQFLRLFLYKGVCYLASPLVAKCWTRLNGKSHLVSSSEEGVEFVRDRLHLLEVCCLLSFPAIRNQTGDRYCGVSAAHRTRERKSYHLHRTLTTVAIPVRPAGIVIFRCQGALRYMPNPLVPHHPALPPLVLYPLIPPRSVRFFFLVYVRRYSCPYVRS